MLLHTFTNYILNTQDLWDDGAPRPKDVLSYIFPNKYLGLNFCILLFHPIH